MRPITEKKNLSSTIAILTAIVTLAIAPGYAYDAFTTLKLLFIYAIGGISLFFVILNTKELRNRLGKTSAAILLALILNMLLILLMSEINISQQFYGVSGRYTGFGTYFSLIVTLFAVALSSNLSGQRKILYSFLTCGILSIIYSLFQYSGNDFVQWDGNAASKVIGFVGNPNFVSVILALTATLSVSKILDSKNGKASKSIHIIVIIGAVIGLKGANATQGFLIFALGIAINVYFFSRFKFRSRIPSRIVLGASILGIFGGLLDIFQKSPWDPFLYGETISIRGDYWRAGWHTALSHPIFGVGFDGYLNYFRRSRDLTASYRVGTDVPTDAAHNVFLDFAASGGFIFLILNLILIGLISKTGIKYLKNMQKFESNFIAIFAIWVGLMIQSIISINQLGLVIWSWVFGGLILGARHGESSPVQNLGRNRRKFNFRLSLFGATTAIMGLLGGIIAMPIVIADHNFKKAIDSKSALQLYNAANSWPPITKKMVLVSAVLTQNKIYKESQVLSKRTLRINPDSFEGWIIYAHNPLLNEAEISEIKKQLLRLDPNIKKLGGVDKYLAEKLAQSTN